MIHPEAAGLKLTLRPPYRPQALNVSLNNAGIAVLAALGALGVVDVRGQANHGLG